MGVLLWVHLATFPEKASSGSSPHREDEVAGQAGGGRWEETGWVSRAQVAVQTVPRLTGRAFWRRPFIPIPKKGNAKECSNYCTIALISHASKVMLEILQARLQQYVNCELPDVQADFRKGRGTRDQIASIRWIIGKEREFQKNIYFCFIDYAKPLTVWITINCGKF